jgi:hypothetical protein
MRQCRELNKLVVFDFRGFAAGQDRSPQAGRRWHVARMADGWIMASRLLLRRVTPPVMSGYA